MEEEQTKTTRQIESLCGAAIEGYWRSWQGKWDDLLADETLSNDSAAHLNVIREQLEGKMKVLTNLDGRNRKPLPGRRYHSRNRRIWGESSLSLLNVSERLLVSCQIRLALRPYLRILSPLLLGLLSSPRLPKLTLQKFRGVVTTWSTFWDSFKAAVHDNDSIPKIDKFNYLNSSLEGVCS